MICLWVVFSGERGRGKHSQYRSVLQMVLEYTDRLIEGRLRDRGERRGSRTELVEEGRGDRVEPDGGGGRGDWRDRKRPRESWWKRVEERPRERW